MPGAAVVEAEKGVERRALFLGKALARVDGSGAIQGLACGVDPRELSAVEGKGVGGEGLAPEVDVRGAIQGLGEGVGRVEARDVEGKGRAQVADDEEGVARGRRCCENGRPP